MLRELKRLRHNKRIFLVFIIIIIFVLGFVFVERMSSFKMEKRLNNIKNEQKKDDNDFKTVGWIRVQGTKIDMPIIAIVNGDDFPVTREKYAWTLNNDDYVYNSMRIYGHNIYNLSANPKISSKKFKRFEEVLAFLYYDFAKENQYIQLSMGNKEYLYKIFSVAVINAYNISHLPIGENSRDDLTYEIKIFKQNSLYDYNMKVTEDDKLLSLVTCTRINGRNSDDNIVVSAKQVHNYPINRINKIKTTEKYEELIKVMEGENADEKVAA